jgi:PAS domain S-box-containing protein
MTSNRERGIQPPLRSIAEAHIKGGTAPPARTWATGADALALLHGLASAPASAVDALKLLHELQVHQVELDLQHEQLEQGRLELSAQRDQYAELFEFAPVGYLRVDREGRIIEANRASESLLGAPRDELEGRLIGNFLAPQSGPVLLAGLARLVESGEPQTCDVNSIKGEGSARGLQVMVSAAPAARYILMAFTGSHTPV